MEVLNEIQVRSTSFKQLLHRNFMLFSYFFKRTLKQYLIFLIDQIIIKGVFGRVFVYSFWVLFCEEIYVWVCICYHFGCTNTAYENFIYFISQFPADVVDKVTKLLHIFQNYCAVFILFQFLLNGTEKVHTFILIYSFLFHIDGIFSKYDIVYLLV